MSRSNAILRILQLKKSTKATTEDLRLEEFGLFGNILSLQEREEKGYNIVLTSGYKNINNKKLLHILNNFQMQEEELASLTSLQSTYNEFCSDYTDYIIMQAEEKYEDFSDPELKQKKIQQYVGLKLFMLNKHVLDNSLHQDLQDVNEEEKKLVKDIRENMFRQISLLDKAQDPSLADEPTEDFDIMNVFESQNFTYFNYIVKQQMAKYVSNFAYLEEVYSKDKDKVPVETPSMVVEFVKKEIHNSVVDASAKIVRQSCGKQMSKKDKDQLTFSMVVSSAVQLVSYKQAVVTAITAGIGAGSAASIGLITCGIGVGVIALACIAFIGYKWYKRRAKLKEMALIQAVTANKSALNLKVEKRFDGDSPGRPYNALVKLQKDKKAVTEFVRDTVAIRDKLAAETIRVRSDSTLDPTPN